MVFPDVEGALKQWLKAQTPILDVIGDPKFVYFEAPDTSAAVRPAAWLTFARLGGAPPDSDIPQDIPLISFLCWGRTRLKAAQLAGALVTVLKSIGGPNGPAIMGASNELRCNVARIQLHRYQPDQNGTAAYAVDAFLYFVIPELVV